MTTLAISAEEFRRLADEVVGLSAQFLSNLNARPIFPATSGEETERLFAEDLPERGLGEQALAALEAEAGRLATEIVRTVLRPVAAH